MQRFRHQRFGQLSKPHLQHSGDIVDILRPFVRVEVDQINVYETLSAR